MAKSKYLERSAVYDHALIETPIHQNVDLIIVIPCYNEPDITPTLDSLASNSPSGFVELIIVINASELASDQVVKQNQIVIDQITKWSKSNKPEWLQIWILDEQGMPAKHAGVGLARKTGMDEAYRRFLSIGKTQEGIIVCLDADSLVESNYLEEIERHFKIHSNTPGCSIHFEHPLEQENQDEIINYELHLRYFINAQKWAGHPHAYQTVGSSMAVRAEVYASQGGMPKRQAGEDFYFLHKIIPLGNFTELKSTKTIPSPRSSDRVPFGTGKDIAEQHIKNEAVYTTYNFDSFVQLKELVNIVADLFEKDLKVTLEALPKEIRAFLIDAGGLERIESIKQSTSDLKAFEKRFYQWFNAFMIMKYCHYMRENGFPDQEVLGETEQLLKHLELKPSFLSKREGLLILRAFDLR